MGIASDNRAASVLVLDDVGAIVSELITLLQLHGVSAVGGETLDEGIAALEAMPSIKVVACDVRLGTESGLDIVSRVATHRKLGDRDLHYIFITGDPMHAECLPGASEHTLLTKPVRPRLLIEIIKRLL